LFGKPIRARARGGLGFTGRTGYGWVGAMTAETPHPKETVHRLARLALFGFLLTFLAARAVVFLIMSHQIPNMYCFLQGTHVHHLNYGIFLLSVVGGYSVLRRPGGRAAELTALAYGIAMALTFDEFGMWLHLGGSYWQRASVDAVIIIGALLALVTFSRSIRKFESHHFRAFIVLVVALAGFAWVLYTAGNHLGELVGPKLQELEISSSP
jgi:hypothetical protein